ncbi:adenylate/guanylate cyclase domain-containing protein [uncultured Croceitalea sp.]|uniref:adenylate/guanylate cyclase domain-containing protein n=1 Tax=uncultured Croceitalea sp. TaxID=1798908 RepID=UPI00330654EE
MGIKLSPYSKRNIRRIIPFGIIWLVISWAFLYSEYAVLGDQSNTPHSAIRITPQIVVFASFSVFLVGTLVGFLETFFLNRIFIRRSFLQKILGKFFVYMVLMFVLILVFYCLAASIEMNVSVFNKAVWQQYLVFFFSVTHISTSVQLAFSLLVSLLYAEISDNLGQHVLPNFFTGKYHRPVVEDRIFMFVDMKDSTTIAETLGSKTYFELLRSYYFDFSKAIIKNSGEVYQYVGDEIVITWKLGKGLKHNHCIRCFYDMKADLEKKAKTYQKKFGITPNFKAALHCGEVTTGEIGALKKEIFFTGDVLNTTARIQNLCNSYNTDVLISGDLMEELQLEPYFEAKPLGKSKLKGKEHELELFTLHEKSNHGV